MGGVAARGCMSDHVAAHSASVLPDFVQKLDTRSGLKRTCSTA